MISGIQHFIFCRRQWALIHVEQQWADNRLTAEGEVMHRNAHKDSFVEKRPGILVTRGLRVSSAALGMTGQCDVVEFRSADSGAVIHGHRGYWDVIPVEYKRGKIKRTSRISASSAARPCAWKKCWAAKFPMPIFSIMRSGGAERWNSPALFARQFEK